LDDGIFDRIFSVAAAAWAAVAMLAVRLFHTWPNVMDRLNERKRDVATEKAGDWDRIRADRDYWHDKAHEYQQQLTEERAAKIEYMSRAVTAEAHLEGRGRARQEAATIVAIERLTDAAKKTNGNGGGK
jgi:hypothetical protein